MKAHGKKYVEASGKVDNTKSYTPAEAIKILKELGTRKFDETIEVVVRLNIDAKKTDMNIRSSLVLPNGTGKNKKVLVITKNSAEEATKAGADYVGEMDMIEKIEKENWFDFDLIVATPEMMPALGKIGKILGPKGLMPNPKLGTVTTNVKLAVENIKKGQIEFKNDTYGNVHAILGKLSFKELALEENLKAFISEINKLKPSGVKGTYIKNISISSTMSPGLKIDRNSLDK